MKQRKTDYGTIILHWLLVAAIGVAFLRAAHRNRRRRTRPGSTRSISSCRRPACGRCISRRRRAGRRVDRARDLSGQIRPQPSRAAGQGPPARPGRSQKQVRLGAVSVLLTWIFFGAMVTLIISGGLLYFGVFAGYSAVDGALVRGLGRARFRLPAHPDPLQNRRHVAIAADVPPRAPAAAAAAPRCGGTSDIAGREDGAATGGGAAGCAGAPLQPEPPFRDERHAEGRTKGARPAERPGSRRAAVRGGGMRRCRPMPS